MTLGPSKLSLLSSLNQIKAASTDSIIARTLVCQSHCAGYQSHAFVLILYHCFRPHDALPRHHASCIVPTLYYSLRKLHTIIGACAVCLCVVLSRLYYYTMLSSSLANCKLDVMVAFLGIASLCAARSALLVKWTVCVVGLICHPRCTQIWPECNGKERGQYD